MNSHDLTRPNEKGPRAPAPIAAALLFISFLGFYLYTLQPSLAWGDGAKLQIEALTGQSFILADLPDDFFRRDTLPFARLGVAAWDHPLYVMLGYTLVQIFPAIPRTLADQHDLGAVWGRCYYAALPPGFFFYRVFPCGASGCCLALGFLIPSGSTP